VFARAHRALLKLYQRLPRQARRFVVRRVAPQFTVGAACIIERHDGRVLLVRQSYRKGWGMPGGLTQRREPIDECARREVREEIGLVVELQGEPAVVVDPIPRRIDVIFLARPAAGVDPDEARPCSPEIAEVTWFETDDLPELQHETTGAFVALARLEATRPRSPLPRPAP
jgi:ADP-ribose pyrophosphatase YjhB (NUDIX family)